MRGKFIHSLGEGGEKEIFDTFPEVQRYKNTKIQRYKDTKIQMKGCKLLTEAVNGNTGITCVGKMGETGR